MKNILKKSLLSISSIVLATIPIVGVMSCSNNSNNSNNNDIPKDIVDAIKDFENNSVDVSDKIIIEDDGEFEFYKMSNEFYSFYNKIASKNTDFEVKTEEEILEISRNIFDKLNEEKLKKILTKRFKCENTHDKFSLRDPSLNEDPKSFYKKSFITTSENRKMTDISEIKYNETNKTISFKLKIFIETNESTSLSNNKYLTKAKITYKFENLKIEPNIDKITFVSGAYYMPTIKISDIQDKNPSIIFLENESSVSWVGDYQLLRKDTYNNIDPTKFKELTGQELSPMDMVIDGNPAKTSFDETLQGIKILEKNNQKLGYVDEVFKVTNNDDFRLEEQIDYNDLSVFSSFDESYFTFLPHIGFAIDPISLISSSSLITGANPTPIYINSPIFIFDEETNDWLVYKKSN